MGQLNATRILACAALASAGVAVAAGCPILAPAVAALGSEQIGGKVVDTIAGVAANILAADVQSNLDHGGFDPQTNHDLHLAIGQAIAVAFEREAARHAWMSRGRRRTLKLAAVAPTQWIRTRNIAAFPPLRADHAVHHLTAAAGEGDTAPPVMDNWRDWLGVFGELGRLADLTDLPDHVVMERVASDLHERFAVYLRNILKGDLRQSNGNRAFNALHLDFMRLVIAGQARAAEQLAETKELTKDVLEKLKTIEGQLAANVRRVTGTLDADSSARLSAITHGIERAEASVAEMLRSMGRIERGVGSIEEKTERILRLLNAGQPAGEVRIGSSPYLQTASTDAVRSLVSAAAEGNQLAARAIDDYQRTRDVEQFKAYFDQFTNQADAIAIERHHRRAALMYTVGDVDRAVDSLQKVLALDGRNADATCLMGQVHQLRGQLVEAEACYRRTVELAADDTAAEADGTAGLAQLRLIRGETEEAEALFRHALSIVEKTGDERAVAVQLGNLAVALRMRYDLAGAEEMGRKALQIHEKHARTDAVADSYANLGTIHQFRGDLDEAESMYRRSLELNQQLGRTANVASQLGNLGQVRSLRGDTAGATDFHLKALDIGQSLGSVETIATACGNLGVVFRNRGDLEQAESYYRRSMQLHEQMGKLSGLAGCQVNLAVIRSIRDDDTGAEQLLLAAIDIYEKIDQSHGLAGAYGNLGLVRMERGDLEGAESTLRKSLEIAEQLGHRQFVANQLSNLARVMQSRGDLAGAEDFYRRAIDENRAMGRLSVLADNHQNLGLVLVGQEAIDRAAQSYAESLRLNRELGRNSETADCLIGLGSTMLSTSEGAEAEHLFREAIELAEAEGRHDLVGRALMGLGLVQARQGDAAAAKASWERARASAEQAGIASLVESINDLSTQAGDGEA